MSQHIPFLGNIFNIIRYYYILCTSMFFLDRTSVIYKRGHIYPREVNRFIYCNTIIPVATFVFACVSILTDTFIFTSIIPFLPSVVSLALVEAFAVVSRWTCVGGTESTEQLAILGDIWAWLGAIISAIVRAVWQSVFTLGWGTCKKCWKI